MYIYIDPYLYICATCRCICIYSMHSYIDTTYTFTPIPPFVCRYIYPFSSVFPRNAGILGVPNASGPMTDVEGRKRWVQSHWWETAPFSNYAEVLYDQLAYTFFSTYFDLHCTYLCYIVYEDICVYIYICSIYSLFVYAHLHSYYTHTHGIFKYVVCLDVFFCVNTLILKYYICRSNNIYVLYQSIPTKIQVRKLDSKIQPNPSAQPADLGRKRHTAFNFVQGFVVCKVFSHVLLNLFSSFFFGPRRGTPQLQKNRLLKVFELRIPPKKNCGIFS